MTDSAPTKLYHPQRSRSQLARARWLQGFSQAGLAERAGVSRRAIAAYERGEHGPRLTTATKLARALGIDDPRVLFPEQLGGEDEPTQREAT